MFPYEEFPASPKESPPALHRTRSIPDLNRLLRKSRAVQSQSHASSRRSENNQSENSQILYMADPKKTLNMRKKRQSLSSIGNGIDRRFDGSSDEKENTLEAEKLSWDVIHQEICEWQYVCQTGRPYWWSPESKYTRLKRYKSRLSHETSTTLWMRELDGRPTPAYVETRRAVSDNYFCDPKSNHDLAHLVAIQLLGACFTLPPDHILGTPSPNYSFDKLSACLPDPRMISSLRMHTQFRYSPSFGHQARNTSPVQAWPRAFSKSSPGFTSPTAEIGPSSFATGRRERRRTLNLNDGSGSCGSVESVGGHLARSCSSNDGLDSDSRAWRTRQGSHVSRTSSAMPNSSSYEIQRLRRYLGRHSGSKAIETSSEQAAQKTHYRLEPVIRSEPHHVFIQPVRELVVKRWRNLKRRMSGSLHSAFQSKGSEDQGSISDIGSPALSSDGKARRRRAQERGDIHSSDVETVPHFNTPVSGHLTPSGGLPTIDQADLVDEASFRLSNQNIAEAALASAESRPAASLSMSSSRSSSQAAPSESARPGMGYQSPPTLAPSRPAFPLYSPARHNPPVASRSFSSRRLNREKRKSTLSEMFTADDFQEVGPENLNHRSVSSAPVTANVTPMEEIEQDFGHAASTPAVPTLREPVSSLRPRLARTSTSGTQIFTPEDDGIELDGLPVGPSENRWNGPGNKERTYL
ncbi:hypothetical protein VTL71DRAFT_4343 [Oculimacula yallundae]|uniref:Uncharacterized protein n=1 Tax=Oculimacula yallundae TaxID=86028 RepID=A0ABR4C1R2_9HELO